MRMHKRSDLRPRWLETVYFTGLAMAPEYYLFLALLLPAIVFGPLVFMWVNVVDLLSKRRRKKSESLLSRSSPPGIIDVVIDHVLVLIRIRKRSSPRRPDISWISS